MAVRPDGTVIIATETSIFIGTRPASGSMIAYTVAKAGETFTSIASDLTARLFAGVHDASGSRVVALTQSGGQVRLAGGGSVLTSTNWSVGSESHFSGELVVRANEIGQLSFMEKLQSGNQAGWIDSIPQGQFQEPGSGILDTANSVVLLADSLGRHVLSVSALTGDTILGFSYDSLGRTTQIRDGRNGTISIDWSIPGQVQLLAPTGEASQLDLNNAGLPIRLTREADGATYQAAYASGNLLESWENPVGSETRFDYDADGRIKVDHNARSGSKTILRGGNKDTIAVGVRTATGKETWYDRYRDSLGLWVRRVKSTYGGLEISKTSIDGNTDSTWNEDSTLLVHRSAPRQGMGVGDSSYTIQRLPSGVQLTATRRSEVVYSTKDSLPIISLSRDTFDLGGDKTLIAYDKSSGVLQILSPMGRKTISGFDSLGRISYQWSAGMDTTHYLYNQNGLLERAGATGRQYSFEYNSDSRLLATTDALGHRTVLQRDASGRIVQSSLPDGSRIRFSYDLADQLQSLELGLGSMHNFVYEPMGAESLWVAPNIGGAMEFNEKVTRDLDGNVTQFQHPDGSSSNMEYDSGYRLSKRISVTDTLSFAWAGNTKRKANEIRVDTAGHSDTIAYLWDGSRLLSAESKGFATGKVSFAYDASWRISGISVGTHTANYTYDRDGLPLTAGLLSIGRDAASGRETSTQIGVVTTSTIYQGSRIATRTSVANGQILRKWEYTNDALNRISEIRETDGAGSVSIYDFAYGIDGRVSQVRKNGSVIESYVYDLQGNRTTFSSPTLGSGSATFDARDRMLTQGNTNYGWDANGALSQTATASSSTKYFYDQRGNLLKAILANGKVVEYRIDARDRRIGKLVDGVPQEGFLYKDQLEPVVWLSGNGGIKATFTYGDRGNVPSYMTMNNTNYRFVTDHLGSVRMVVNATTGAVVQEMDYDAFGNVLRNSNPGFQPFGFGGGIADQHTGLVKFGARDYDPQTGRWSSIDPIRFAGGSNLYIYCASDPVNNLDPTGLAVKYNRPPPRTVPPTGENGDALTCVDQCLAQKTLLVTGGQEQSRHSKKSLHYQNKACDIAGPKGNPDISSEDVFSCASLCGYSNGQYEQFPNNPGRDHYHLQLTPGNGVPEIPQPDDPGEGDSGDDASDDSGDGKVTIGPITIENTP